MIVYVCVIIIAFIVFIMLPINDICKEYKYYKKHKKIKKSIGSRCHKEKDLTIITNDKKAKIENEAYEYVLYMNKRYKKQGCNIDPNSFTLGVIWFLEGR